MVGKQRRIPPGEAASRVQISGGLFAAKLMPPRLPAAFVVRQRLLNRLDDGIQGEVTLICAGPGSGKTSLAASWATAGRPPGPVAWLSLDAYDKDPARFWSYLLGAVRATRTLPSGSPLRLIRPGHNVDEAFLRRVAGGLAALPRPMVVVLDDLHEVAGPELLTSLAFLLRHPLPQLRLLVTSRVELALPLYRPRSRTGLVEIGNAELNFTADEAVELLARHDVRLGSADSAAVLERAEGWTTGLVLAARLLSQRGAAAGLREFSGTERTVAEFLTSEVLAHVSPDTQLFLRQTCVADRLSGDLADALTGGTAGHSTLEMLARSNMMVTGLESPPGWFRLHGLLADLLRHQVRLETPGLFREQNIKAAHWYATQDAALPAVGHAVTAEDWPLVGRLVTTLGGPRILSVDRGPLVELLSRIPEHELSATAELEMCSALLAFHRADYTAIRARVARARALLPHEAPDLRLPIEIMAGSIECALAREGADMPALIKVTEDTLNRLMEVSPAQLPRAREYRAISLNNSGVGLFWMGRRGPAEARLRAGMAMAEAVGVELAQLNALSHLALLEADQGRLRETDQYAGIGMELAANRGWLETLQAVPTYVALALAHLGRDDLDAADAAISQGLAAQRRDPEPIQSTALLITQLRLLLARGEVDAARLLDIRIGREVGAEPPPLLSQWLSVARAELELCAGDPDAVFGMLNDLSTADQESARMRICVARAHLARGQSQEAVAVLTSLQRSAPDVGVAVETWVLTGLVEDGLRQNNRSIDAVARAVALAEPHNLRRPFLGADQPAVARLLERYQWLVPEHSSFVAALLKDLNGIRVTIGGETEDLTDRELDVLRYLPTMLKNQDIADQMFVSVNTVKAHVRALYRKLGVTQRREAVDRARELGLL